MMRHCALAAGVILIIGSRAQHVYTQEWADTGRPYQQYSSQDYPFYEASSDLQLSSQQPREINSAFFSKEVDNKHGRPPGSPPGAWESCVKMCVRFDPRTGRVTFTGGDLDCVNQCQKQFGNPARASARLESRPQQPASTAAQQFSSGEGSTPALSSPPPHQWNARSNSPPLSSVTSGLPTTSTVFSTPFSPSPGSTLEPTAADGFPATHTTSYLECGLNSCKKIAEYDSTALATRGVQQMVPKKVLRDFTTQGNNRSPGNIGEQKADVNAIYSTLMKGWKVLEDICEVFSRAKQYRTSGSEKLTDKAIMCNVLQATGKANFNKEDCLKSAEVDDLLKGCQQLAKSKSSSRDMILKVASDLNHEVSMIKENQHKDPGVPKQNGDKVDFRTELPANTFSQIQADLAGRTKGPVKQAGELKVERGPDQNMPTASITATFPLQEGFLPESQKLSMCINAELLKSKEVNAIKNLTETIGQKQEEIEQLEGKVDKGPKIAKLIVEPPVPFNKTLKESPKVNKTKPAKAKEGEEVSRLSCLRDFIMLRKTMNEILSKLEDKYRALVKEKQHTTQEYEDFGSGSPPESSKEKLGVSPPSKSSNEGSVSEGHVYYDQQPIEDNYVDYPSQVNRRQEQAQQKTRKPSGDSSIVGLLQVDPNGNKNGTMTIKHINNHPSQEYQTSSPPSAGSAANRFWGGLNPN